MGPESSRTKVMGCRGMQDHHRGSQGSKRMPFRRRAVCADPRNIRNRDVEYEETVPRTTERETS